MFNGSISRSALTAAKTVPILCGVNAAGLLEVNQIHCFVRDDMDNIFAYGQRILLCLSGAYIGFLVLLSTPYFQRQYVLVAILLMGFYAFIYSAIFLHAIRWPLFVDFETPATYGLAGM